MYVTKKQLGIMEHINPLLCLFVLHNILNLLFFINSCLVMVHIHSKIRTIQSHLHLLLQSYQSHLCLFFAS
ncbi:hypothetical protein HanRHA438_Chr15g0690601 [Helianthus annuus]|nr:hypothetical protein HanRHA438_Chr15g0690601 [Helianthus annuus]